MMQLFQREVFHSLFALARPPRRRLRMSAPLPRPPRRLCGRGHVAVGTPPASPPTAPSGSLTRSEGTPRTTPLQPGAKREAPRQTRRLREPENSVRASCSDRKLRVSERQKETSKRPDRVFSAHTMIFGSFSAHCFLNFASRFFEFRLALFEVEKGGSDREPKIKKG